MYTSGNKCRHAIDPGTRNSQKFRISCLVSFRCDHKSSGQAGLVVTKGRRTITGGSCHSIIFVATKLLSRPKRVFFIFVATKYFVTTNIIMSRQAYFCGDKRRVFYATKMILVAAPANVKDCLHSFRANTCTVINARLIFYIYASAVSLLESGE